MNFLDLLDPSFLSEMLSNSGKAQLTEKFILLGVIWAMFGRKFAKHLRTIEERMSEGFGSVTKSVGDVREALIRVETTHTLKLQNLSESVEKLDGRVSHLEKH